MPLLLLFFAIFAETAGTLAGFGSSTIFLPLAVLILPFRAALTLVAFLHIFGNLGRLWWFRKGFRWRIALAFGAPSVVFSVLGAAVAGQFPQEILRGLLGVFLIFYAGFSLLKKLPRLPHTKRVAVFGGAVSGFLAGLIGTGGALRGAFLITYKLPKEAYLATAAAVAIGVDATRIPVYLAQGFLPQEYMLYVPVLFLAALIGSFLGKRIVAKVPEKVFQRIVLAALFAIGVVFVWKTFVG